MTDRGKPVSQLTVWSNSVSGNDALMLFTRSQTVPDTYTVNVNVLFGNIDIHIGDGNSLSANLFSIRYATTPANSFSLSVPRGTIFWDNNYIYIAISDNNVRRAAISAF